MATQQTLDITIREAKQLRIGDRAIQAGSEADVAKLRRSVEWLADLGSKAKVVRQSFGIIAFNIRTDEVNMEDKEGIIARIQARNGSVPSLKKLDICWANVLLVTKLMIGNAMKGKKTLIVLQQPASRPQTDIPLHPPLHPPPTFDIFFQEQPRLSQQIVQMPPKSSAPKLPKTKVPHKVSSAAENQNTNLSTPEHRPGVNTPSQAGSKCPSSEMDSPENSQKEQNKRPPTINKDARPPLAEKSNKVESRSVASKTPSLKDSLPNTITPTKTLAQEISDQLLRENNSHENNQSSAKSTVK